MGWGISRLIGLKAAVLLSVAYFFHGLGVTLISFPLIYASMIAMLISIASHPAIDLPLLLGKASDGSFPLWSWIMFSPFLLFIHMFVLLRRFVKNEPLYTEIADGVFVGGWPSSVEHLPPCDPLWLSILIFQLNVARGDSYLHHEQETGGAEAGNLPHPPGLITVARP